MKVYPLTPLSSPKRILLVEKNRLMRNKLTQILNADNFDVLLIENCRDAMEITKRFRPDAILFGSEMPAMDGITLFNTVRKTAGLTEILFIFLRATPLLDESPSGRELGIGDCLARPFDLKSLIAVLNARLRVSFNLPPCPERSLQSRGEPVIRR